MFRLRLFSYYLNKTLFEKFLVLMVSSYGTQSPFLQALFLMCSDYYSLGLKFKVLKLKYILRIGFSTENVCFQMWRGDQNNTEDIAGKRRGCASPSRKS